MKPILTILICVSVAIMASFVLGYERRKDAWRLRDERWVEECKQEMNLSWRLTVDDIRPNDIPTKREIVCLMDCYYLKIGRLVQKNNSLFVEYAFADPPSRAYLNETDQFMITFYKAIDYCKEFMANHHVERCNFMYLYRHCVDKFRSESESDIPLSTRLG